MDFDQAAIHVKKHLFDYDNLSKFEKEFMRRGIPFYTWTRKNLALQLQTLSTKPIAEFRWLGKEIWMDTEPALLL